jgi:8-oxo-dGTP diphosphatase
MMTNYVLGFCFDSAGKNVVLIRKTKPAWQAGKFNGVGGKIETRESQGQAMVREFYEEAGVMTTPDNWEYFGSMAGPGWACGLFYTFNDFIFRKAATQTEEEIHTFPVFIAQSEIPTISNVPWIVEAARNHKQNNGEFQIRAEYK